MSDGRESVFLGGDWVLYAGMPGDFERSEMVAPCLLQGRPGSAFRVTPDGSAPLKIHSALHPSGLWSSGSGPGVLLLYLDALSDEGSMVQRFCVAGGGCVPWPSPASHDVVPFDALLQPDDATALARAHVEHWRAEMRRLLPPAPPTDARLKRVAALIAGCPEGRLDLAPLGASAHLSPDHLRHAFKQGAGMTLSRYQMWQRLRQMVQHACEASTAAQRLNADGMIHAAGFYDTSHGSRAIRRYFGISAASAANQGIRFTDCRSAEPQGSGHR